MSNDQQKTYWVQIFNETTWAEFVQAGGKVTGFRDARWGHVQKMKVGDCPPLLPERSLEVGGHLGVDFGALP